MTTMSGRLRRRAQPTIGRALSVLTSDISWVLGAYLLAASVLTPILGRR
ncbi:MFS transporter [Micromonospora sp. ALFpr18c]|nr:MFS transporter [Micromonospora sp. ALFpr18c]